MASPKKRTRLDSCEILTVGDLFCGAGGLAEGFRQAGFTSVFANDVDAASCRTFALNFATAKVYERPIEELSAEEVLLDAGLEPGDLDVLVGGPPCQGFSINAPIRSDEDPRNHLFRQYVRLVLEGLKPKVVVFENVPGLLSMGDTLRDVGEAFLRAGYRIKHGLLNAAHYGVPQERWRLIIVGTRVDNINPSLPEPVHYSRARANFRGGRTHTFAYAVGEPGQRQLDGMWLQPPVSVRDALDDLPRIGNGGGAQEMPYDREPQSDYQLYARANSGDMLWNHQCARLSPVNVERFAHVPPGGSWRDIPFDLLPEGMKRARRSDHTKRYGRIDPGALSTTIMTKCDPHWGTFVHYDETRIISVREAARIQSFPDHFRFLGSLTEQYRQVGNAVPPLLAKAIALQVRAALEGHRSAS